MKKIVTYSAILLSVCAVGLPQKAHAMASRTTVLVEACDANTTEGRDILFDKNATDISRSVRMKLKRGKSLNFNDAKDLYDVKISDRLVREYAKKSKSGFDMTSKRKSILKSMGASDSTIRVFTKHSTGMPKKKKKMKTQKCS